MELAKAFQVCLCCSVTPAHTPLALSTRRQAFDPDLHVWHIRPGPGLCSLWSETQECQRDCLADLTRTEPDPKLYLNQGQRQDLGLWRERNERHD